MNVKSLSVFAATSIMIMGSGRPPVPISGDHPNIILIQVDQMRPDHLGKNTPVLMELAGKGVLFSHAYTAAPVCQPSRTSIITGLYPSQTKICGNQSDPVSDEMRDNTFMNRLKKSGYYTVLVGKHHYLDRYAIGMDVVKEDKEEIKRYGFDQVTQCLDVGEHIPNNNKTENVDDYIYYLRSKGLEKKYFAEVKEGLKSGHHPLDPDDAEDGFIGKEAARFIKSYTGEKPFYLNISFTGPHPPYMVAGEFHTRPEDTPSPNSAPSSAATSKKRAIYSDMCANIDHYVGLIIEELKTKSYFENTVIIFTADHGDNLGDYGIWDKRYFYEQSAGVPLFISGKNIRGTENRFEAIHSKALVSTLDIYPTIMSLAGIQMTEGERPGRNLLEIINDKKSVFREAVFSELGTCSMIRTAGWKMVFDPEEGGITYLFNLIVDPGESKNLAGVAGYEDISAGLTSQLLAHYITLNQFTHFKEQMRLQKVRVMYNN